jgi:hypothetical protein
LNALYQKRLADLKKELSKEKEKRKKKKKKFTQNQEIMIDFINNVTKNATFDIKGVKIILREGWGDGKGIKGSGFQHILEKHYCKGCPGELTLSDILNMDLVAQKGIELNTIGVSNPDNKVIKLKDSRFNHKLILKKERENELVVTYYSMD